MYPVSPFGLSGTRGPDGTLCDAQGAGSGGGGGNSEFVERLAGKDRGDSSPLSPLNVLLAHYVKPLHVPEHLDIFVESMLSTRTGDDYYPGTARKVDAWPGFAPGDRGVLNTMAPTHFRIAAWPGWNPSRRCSGCAAPTTSSSPTPPCTTWPTSVSSARSPAGPASRPGRRSPMVAQTRAALDGYAVAGGRYREVVIEDAGHGPHLDQPEKFLSALHDQLASA